MKVFTRLKATAKYITPHLSSSCSNITAFVGSLVLPALDLIVLAFYHTYSNRINEDIDNSNNGANNSLLRSDILVITSAVVGISFFVRPAVIRIITENVKTSLKLSNLNKLLHDNKFLLSAEHSKSSGNIKSFYDTSLGDRVDGAIDSFIPIIVTLPVNLISLSAGMVRIEMISNFFETGEYKVVLSIMAGTGVLLYLIGIAEGKYDEKESEINSTVLARGSFIENNRDGLVLTNSIAYEKKLIKKELKAKDKIMSPYTGLQILSTGLSIGVGEFVSYYLLKNSKASTGIPGMLYLTYDLFILFQDLQQFINILSEGFLKFEDNAEKLASFNLAYEEWDSLYNQYNRLIVEYEGTVFSLQDFSVSIRGEKEVRIEIDQHESTKSELEEDLPIFEHEVLKHANLILTPGQIYRLMGKSGLGKTTILKAMVGCWPYTEGNITYPVKKADICFIPQKLFMLNNANIIEILAYPLTVTDLVDKQEDNYENLLNKIRELFAYSGLRINDLEEEGINWEGRLSGGEKQKLAIISALIKQPGFLFMDEATSNLDPANQARMWMLIKQHLPNATIIYTEHHNIPDIGAKELYVQDLQLVLLGESYSAYGAYSSDA